MENQPIQQPFVSIIIPTRRDSKILQKCLDSLFLQNYPKEKMEIILVTEGKPEISLTQELKVSIILKDLNCAKARNEAVKIARGEILAFIDDDCVAPADWLSRGVSLFTENNVGLVGGPALPFENESFSLRLAGYLSQSFFVGGYLSNRYKKVGNKTIESNGYDLILANNFVLKQAFEKINGFNPDQFAADDYDFYLKLNKARYKLLYSPELFVWHKAKPIFLPWSQKVFYYSSGRGVLMARRLETIKPLFFIPSLFFLFFFGFLTASWFFAKLFILWKGILFLYLLWNLIGAFYVFFKNERNFLVILASPLATFLVHCSYGLGIIFGFYLFFSGNYKWGFSLNSKY